jgi:hypothetical protein
VRSSLTGVDIFNTVMLQRSQDKRLVIIVESDEDSGVIDPHLVDSRVQTFPGYGKESVLLAAQMFVSNQMNDVIAIVDADLDRYTGRVKNHPPNVVMTEFYDLDADVVFHCPQALEAIAVNFSNKTQREAYLASHGVSIGQIIWGMAITVGEIRYSSIMQQWKLNLRGFPLHAILAEYEQKTARDAVVSLALARTPGAPVITAQDVAREVAAISDKLPIASGHDLLSALAALARDRWGGTVGQNQLASALRSATQCHCWKKTVVYSFVQAWALQFRVDAWSCP